MVGKSVCVAASRPKVHKRSVYEVFLDAVNRYGTKSVAYSLNVTQRTVERWRNAILGNMKGKKNRNVFLPKKARLQNIVSKYKISYDTKKTLFDWLSNQHCNDSLVLDENVQKRMEKKYYAMHGKNFVWQFRGDLYELVDGDLISHGIYIRFSNFVTRTKDFLADLNEALYVSVVQDLCGASHTWILGVKRVCWFSYEH